MELLITDWAATMTLRAVAAEWCSPWTQGPAVWPGHAARRGHSGHCPDYTTRPSILHPRHSPGPLTASLSAGSEIQLLGTRITMGSGKERESGIRDHKALGWGQRSGSC